MDYLDRNMESYKANTTEPTFAKKYCDCEFHKLYFYLLYVNGKVQQTAERCTQALNKALRSTQEGDFTLINGIYISLHVCINCVRLPHLMLEVARAV